MSECAVCLQTTTHVASPCRHAVCRACLDRWMDLGRLTCPVCRGVVVPAHDGPRGALTVRVDVTAPGTHVGITFSNCARGVRVVRVHPEDRAAASGMRKGDTVTHINSVRVRDHASAIAMTNRATEGNMLLVYTLARRFEWRACFPSV